MTHPNTAPTLTDSEVQIALEQARRLVKAGVPVFAAPPCSPGCGQPTHPAAKPHYALPKHWTQTVPSEVNLNNWKPGWALAAIGGFAADFLDVDPRNGGDATAQGLRDAGLWPRTFGRQLTPSGGFHDIITPTGQRKGELAPGVDLQAGQREGRHGLGFVYLAPTVGVSKVTGELVPYRWETPPDTEALAEWRGQDDSTEHVITMMTAKRAAPSVPAQREPIEIDVDDPFATAAVPTGPASSDRAFTPTEAQDFLRPILVSLQEAKIGQIEERANVAAAALSHFVPAFWTPDQAFTLLTNALAHTAYDPTHQAATWRAEKFQAVLSGQRPPLDNWKATRRIEPPTAPSVTVEAAPGQEAMSTLDRLRSMLVTMDEVASRPAPEPLVYGLLNLNTEAWLIGAPGSLKSFVALDLAGHIGSGRDWQGHRVRKGKVLYIAAEGADGMTLRTRAWLKTHGDPGDVIFLPYPVQVKSNDGQWEALTQLSRELEPSLIVIDTQARVSVGLEENSATDMGVLISAVGSLKRATGACVLVVHHTGRNGGDARGSSALDGAQDTELKVVRAEPRSSLVCKLVQDKQKDMAEGDAGGLPLRLRVVDLGTDEVTGRELSSLVVMSADDPYEEAQGVDMVDVEPWRGRHPEPWTTAGGKVPAQSYVKRRILQALADHAGMTGLTEAITRRVVKDRWEEPSATGWTDAWQAVKDLEGLVVNVGGERWAIDQAALEGLKNPA
jgi:hypothetical protein